MDPRICPHERRLVFLTVAAGVFLSTTDSSMVNVALPALMREFEASLAVTEWVVLGYLLVITTLLVVWGRIGDHVGRGRIYGAGLLVFSGGSLCCALAGSMASLICFRLAQAVGAAMMMASGPALVRAIYPAERLGRGLGLIGVATSLGLLSGPALGGLLIHWWHWRAVFLVVAPIGLLLRLAGRGVLGQVAEGGARGTLSLDWAGLALWALGVFGLLLTLTHPAGSVSMAHLGGGGLCTLLLFMVFWRRQARVATPMLPPRLLGDRLVGVAILCALLSFALLFAILILMPFFLDKVLGLSPDRIGYVMMAVPLGVLVTSPLAGRLHDRYQGPWVASAGLAVCLVGVLLLRGLDSDSTPFACALRLAVLGCGQAAFLAPNSALVLASVAECDAGIAAGLLATARNLGMLLGVALAGLVFSRAFAGATGGLDLKDFTPAMVPAFMGAMARTLDLVAMLAAGAVLLSLLRRPRPSS